LALRKPIVSIRILNNSKIRWRPLASPRH